MKPSNLFNTDDRAVSPVIGVILMVAITVILAAVIGTFVLGLGDSLGDNQPSAQISVSVENDTATATNYDVVLEHNGGDRINAESLRIVVTDTSDNQADATNEFAEPFTVGDIESGTFTGTTGAGSEDVRVRVIHLPSDSILVDRTFEVDGLATVDGDSITF